MNANPRLCFCKLNEGGVRQDGEGGLVKYTNDMSHRLIYLEVMLIWNNFLLGIKIRENLWQGSKVCKLGSILQSHSREYNAPVKQSIPFYLNHVSSQQDHCFGPVSNTYTYLQHIWKGWRIERLGHPWCDKALFGFRARVHILLYWPVRFSSSIGEGERVSLGFRADQLNSSEVKVELVDHPDTFSTGVVSDLVTS